MALLELDAISTYYGGIRALDQVSLTVDEGEIVTLLGANGAGKSTTLRSISGLTPAASGSVRFDGQDITSTPTEKIVKLGICHCPEGRECFARMTVEENLALGAFLRKDDGIADTLTYVLDLFPRLKDRLSQAAGTMSGGEQQMLAIGRSLMGGPRLLLLDEPSMGIAPVLAEKIYETVIEINAKGTPILLVEQNANYALGVSSRGYVLESGRVVLDDEAAALRGNPAVQAAYLGA